MSSFSFDAWSQSERTSFEKSLNQLFLNDGPPNIRTATRYPLQTGGKRIRPLFVFAAAQAFGEYNKQSALCSALSIELIHTYSLVHDDLPCMDDDDERRGLPTVHKKFGEAPALLVGDALLTEAFSVLCKSPHLAQSLPIISRAAGISGMIGGQSMDIGFEGTIEHLEQLTQLHLGKTGALIKASALLGGIAAEASMKELMRLEAYGNAVGLAFQLADDLLDEEEDQAEDGPPSFVKLLGAEETRKKASYYHQEARAACQEFTNPEALLALADFTISRSY
jgi:geranylgeranyl pyrophosphate synthase